jgi:hypothetical protein
MACEKDDEIKLQVHTNKKADCCPTTISFSNLSK